MGALNAGRVKISSFPHFIVSLESNFPCITNASRFSINLRGIPPTLRSHRHTYLCILKGNKGKLLLISEEWRGCESKLKEHNIFCLYEFSDEANSK